MGDLIRIVRMETKKQVAVHTYLIVCPFHLERERSCQVDELLMTYQCFGCGKQGKVDWKPRRK